MFCCSLAAVAVQANGSDPGLNATEAGFAPLAVQPFLSGEPVHLYLHHLILAHCLARGENGSPVHLVPEMSIFASR